MTIRVATVSLEPTYSVRESVQRHLEYLEEAATAGADLVVFPEISLQGYSPEVFDWDSPKRIADVYATAEDVPTGPNVSRIIEACVESGIHAVFGVTELGSAPGVLHDTAVLAGPEGYIGRYRAVHVGNVETQYWVAGDDWPVFETTIGHIGLLICYDKMFPEAARELTLRGADLLIMPTAWSCAVGEDPESTVWPHLYRMYDQVRAAENSRWFVSSNFYGDLEESTFIGWSQIIDPLGRVVASTEGGGGLVVAEIDVEAGIREAYSEMIGAWVTRDRRPETYRMSYPSGHDGAGSGPGTTAD